MSGTPMTTLQQVCCSWNVYYYCNSIIAALPGIFLVPYFSAKQNEKHLTPAIGLSMDALHLLRAHANGIPLDGHQDRYSTKS